MVSVSNQSGNIASARAFIKHFVGTLHGALRGNTPEKGCDRACLWRWHFCSGDLLLYWRVGQQLGLRTYMLKSCRKVKLTFRSHSKTWL